MLLWLIRPVPAKEKSFLNDDIIKKTQNQKNSRSIVDVYVGYSVVRQNILYVRCEIQALEHFCKRTWDPIIWIKKKKSIQDT